MDHHENTLENHPQVSSHKQATQESFRQNFSFAEKILGVQGMFSTLSDDHDIRKVTREKVEKMLYAHKLVPETQEIEKITHLGPQAINQWIWENRVQREIPLDLLREFLSLGMYNSPHVFFKKYNHVRKLLIQTAEYHGIASSRVQNHHLLDPKSLHHGIQQLAKDKITSSLSYFLVQRSIQAGLLNKEFPAVTADLKQPLLHPRILSFKAHMEEKGFSRKHVRNTCTHVRQLLVWLCANIPIFAHTSPQKISVFQIENEHLLMYRTYKLKLVKEGHYSKITFTHSIYAIRSFYHFLQNRFGYVPPLQRFRSINAPRYTPRELPSDEQIQAFFQVVERYAANPVQKQIGYRLMFDLGLRLSEVAHIKWTDINLGTRTIVIHSKGKKSHVLPLAGTLYSLLQELQQQPIATYLMGEKPSTNVHKLYDYFKLYAMIAEWPFSGGVHLFRHVFITRLAQKGVLPQALKELARVTMLDTVGLYMHLAHHDKHMINQINLLRYE